MQFSFNLLTFNSSYKRFERIAFLPFWHFPSHWRPTVLKSWCRLPCKTNLQMLQIAEKFTQQAIYWEHDTVLQLSSKNTFFFYYKAFHINLFKAHIFQSSRRSSIPAAHPAASTPRKPSHWNIKRQMGSDSLLKTQDFVGENKLSISVHRKLKGDRATDILGAKMEKRQGTTEKEEASISLFLLLCSHRFLCINLDVDLYLKLKAELKELQWVVFRGAVRGKNVVTVIMEIYFLVRVWSTSVLWPDCAPWVIKLWTFLSPPLVFVSKMRGFHHKFKAVALKGE